MVVSEANSIVGDHGIATKLPKGDASAAFHEKNQKRVNLLFNQGIRAEIAAIRMEERKMRVVEVVPMKKGERKECWAL